MLIAASMFAAWLHLETGKRSWLYATFAAVGLGFLAKGPVAILIPFAVTLAFCWLRRDLKTWLRAAFDWRALLLFAAIALPRGCDRRQALLWARLFCVRGRSGGADYLLHA